MIILAADLGLARTGVAVSDAGETLAFPRGVIEERSEERLVEKLAAQAEACGAQCIVVGYPRNMDGSAGPRAQACAHTAELLRARVSCPVELWDERCTTVSAHTALNYTDTRGKKRKAVIDAVAAVMILEDFLAYRKNRAARERP